MKRVVMIMLLNLFCLSTLSHAGNGDFTMTGSIGINPSAAAVPAASAALDITSTTKGFLPPRMTTIQRNAIALPATGLLIYNINEDSYNYYTGTTWISLGASQGTYSAASGYKIFTTSGPFTVPAGVTRVYVEAWGGGGGGGGCASNGASGVATSFGAIVSAPGGGGGVANGTGGTGGAGNDLGRSGTSGWSGTPSGCDDYYGCYDGQGGAGGTNQMNLWGGSEGGAGGNCGDVGRGGGGGGAYVRAYAAVTPGVLPGAVIIGAGGAAGAAPSGATAGSAGRLIVYW